MSWKKINIHIFSLMFRSRRSIESKKFIILHLGSSHLKTHNNFDDAQKITQKIKTKRDCMCIMNYDCPV